MDSLVDLWPRKSSHVLDGALVTDAVVVETEDFEPWMRKRFPSIFTYDFDERHRRLGRWVESLRVDVRPAPICEIWPRGSGKSTIAEGAAAYVGANGKRRFCLYVSGVQEQATAHAQTVAGLLERVGIERLTSKYGHSRGWSRNLIRTANGFNLVAIGLDQAVRGIKFDEIRPDLIILDDIDSEQDSALTILKKKQVLSSAILPSGSENVAVIAIQNLIRDDGVFAEIERGDGILANRQFGGVIPAVRNLQVEATDRADGTREFKIIGGEATWEGQNLRRCELQINEWTLRTFLREAQHEVKQAAGTFFDPTKIGIVSEIPPNARRCRAWDQAATEGGGDWTVGVEFAVWGTFPNLVGAICDVYRGRWASTLDWIHKAAEQDGPGVTIRLAQDPGQAGKVQAGHQRKSLAGHKVVIVPATGSKATRAKQLQDAMAKGAVNFLDRQWEHYYDERGQPMSKAAAWASFRREYADFREDMGHKHDDQVDAGADAWNEAAKPTVKWDLY